MSSFKTIGLSNSSPLLRILISIPLTLYSLSCSRKETGPPEITLAAALLPSEQASYVSVLHTFTEQTGIRVKVVAQQYAEIRTAIEAEAQARRGQLDVAELDVYLLPLLSQLMQPLDTLMATVSELGQNVQKDVWNTGVFGGEAKKMYFVPHRLNWQAMFYDATAVAVPPDDWDAFLKMARENSGKVGLKLSKYEGLVCDVFPLLWQAGGDPLHPDNSAALKAMEFLRQLLPCMNPAVRTYKENSILDAQEHQEIVVHMNWPFAVPLMKERGILNLRVKTAALPKGPAGRATILGGGFLGIPATAPHPREAAKLLDFLTSIQTQRELAASLGWFPIRPEGWEQMSEADKVDYAGFLAMRGYVRARPNVPYYEQVSQIWQDGIYKILFEGHDAKQTLAGMQVVIDKAAGGKSP
jgi:ABC-type glycerol-3-phosphate transport system substrate-binding protein